MTDGTARDLSLLEVFERAPSIYQLAGNPLECAALHRLLLAVVHRVDSPKDRESWLVLWKNRNQLFEAVIEYLASTADKFDLYDPRFPFAQHPGLPHQGKTPAELVYDRAQGNNPVFLDSSVVSSPEPISSAMAIRSLLVTHAFGGSGTGGLNPLNGNKKDTMLAGPLCARFIAVVEGANLAETLLYNLVIGADVGSPVWDREVVDVPRQSRPSGLCDLYTRATRNVKLEPNDDGESCVAVSMVMGDAVLSDEDSLIDPLIPTYLAHDKKYKAMRIDPDKALWRSSQVLLVPEVSESARPLPAVALIRQLVNRGDFQEDVQVRIRTLGVAANAQGPVTEMWRDEYLPFSLKLFSGDDGYQKLANAVDCADKEAKTLSFHLAGFAARYMADGGSSPEPKSISRLIQEISPNLSDFWMEIGPEGERIALQSIDEMEWSKRLVTVRQSAYEAAIDRLPPDARRMRAQFQRGDPGLSGVTETKGRKAK